MEVHTLFTVKSAVLEVQSVTFQLPTGFQLLQEHEEFVDPTLLLSAPEGDYTVTLSLSHSQLPSELELLDIFSEGGYMLLSPVEQITCGALSGHCAAYLSGQQGCWEVRLTIAITPLYSNFTLNSILLLSLCGMILQLIFCFPASHAKCRKGPRT